MKDVEEKKEITIDDLAAMVAGGFAGAKKDLELFQLNTHTHFNNIETDFKSVKRDLFELKNTVDDPNETVMSYDKRIEVLEEKVL